MFEVEEVDEGEYYMEKRGGCEKEMNLVRRGTREGEACLKERDVEKRGMWEGEGNMGRRGGRGNELCRRTSAGEGGDIECR